MNDETKTIFNIIESIGTGTKDKQNLIKTNKSIEIFTTCALARVLIGFLFNIAFAMIGELSRCVARFIRKELSSFFAVSSPFSACVSILDRTMFDRADILIVLGLACFIKI